MHEFLAAHRNELIARCKLKVAQRSAPKATSDELEHGIPLFLEQTSEPMRAVEKIFWGPLAAEIAVSLKWEKRPPSKARPPAAFILYVDQNTVRHGIGIQRYVRPIVVKLEGVLEHLTHRGGEQIAIGINGEAGVDRCNLSPHSLTALRAKRPP